MNLKINNVRLSYPNLWEPKAAQQGGKVKYSASFLMDKKTNATEIKSLQDAILSVAKAEWGDQNVKWNGDKLVVRKADGKGGTIVPICLRDGSDKPETPGYGPTVMFFSASTDMPPPVVDRNPTIPLPKGSPRPYAGCIVNGSIRLWAQDNDFGRRVNAQLNAVQFVADGEAFGDAPVDPAQVFTNVGEPSTDDLAKPFPDGVDTSQHDSDINF
jgi:hypothetical protein